MVDLGESVSDVTHEVPSEPNAIDSLLGRSGRCSAYLFR